MSAGLTSGQLQDVLAAVNCAAKQYSKISREHQVHNHESFTIHMVCTVVVHSPNRKVEEMSWRDSDQAQVTPQPRTRRDIWGDTFLGKAWTYERALQERHTPCPRELE